MESVKTNLLATTKRGLLATVAFSFWEELSFCNCCSEELSSWSFCYLNLRRLIFLQPWRVVFQELMLSQLGETDIPATMKHCLPGAVAISSWEDWSSWNYEDLPSWSCCCLTLRRLIFLQLWRVVFLELLLSHLEKTDLPATMKSCLPGAVAVSPWEGWSFCNYEELSSWNCCNLTLRRLIFLQPWILSSWSCCCLNLGRLIFLQPWILSSWSCCYLNLGRLIFLQQWSIVCLELLRSHLEKTDLPATMKICLPGAVAVSPWEDWSSCNYEELSSWSCAVSPWEDWSSCNNEELSSWSCSLTLRRLIFLQLWRVCFPGSVAISPWEELSFHNHWDPEEQRLSLFPLSGWYHLH
jgi:hypothetical protein